MQLIASLGMYDFADLRAANDALWSIVAEHLGRVVAGVPAALERRTPLPDIWSSEHLLLGQTCGYPFARHHRGRLTVVGAPVYDVPGCDGPAHRSFLVVASSSRVERLLELRAARAAINEDESNTGRQLLGDAVADVHSGAGPFFGSVVRTGSHAGSLRAVAEGEADVAAIDCVTYAHLARSAPHDVARTRILSPTRATPSLPLVTARGEAEAARVADAVNAALRDPRTAAARATLRWTALSPIAPSAYDITLAYAARADRVFS